jgi:hypothetical protein
MINSVGAGKGSIPRKVDLKVYGDNHDEIFRKGKGHDSESTEERLLQETPKGELAEDTGTEQGD